MERGNVLVIGNSGVGKSTLINAVLGEERAETGWGTAGKTKELVIYTSEKIPLIPFRIIDTLGFEPSSSLLKENKAINAVKKWSKDSAKEGHNDKQINVIWFCVEGTSSKLFPKTIIDFSKATSMWKTVPVIVVITKSYSVPERVRNIDMVNNVFAKQKHFAKKLRKVIPVVASTYVLNENAYAAPEGITELIDATNELMPEGIKASKEDIDAFKLKRKRVMAHGITGVSTTAAVVVGAVPKQFPDAIILIPMEMALVKALAQIYEINKNEESKKFFESILEIGTISEAAKLAIYALKAVHGINLGVSVLNAIIAGGVMATLGEVTTYAFEQVYLGNKSVADIEWVKKVIELKFTSRFTDIVKTIIEKIPNNADEKAIARIIDDVFRILFSASDSKKV